MSVRCTARVLKSARTQRAASSVFAPKVFSLLVSRTGPSALPRVRAWHAHREKDYLQTLPFISVFISVQETHRCCCCRTTSASVASTCPLSSIQTMWTTLSTSKPWTTCGIQRAKDSVRCLLQHLFMFLFAALNIKGNHHPLVGL